MATTTPNYGLTKPAANEPALIATINTNFDIVDAALQNLFNVMLPAYGAVGDGVTNDLVAIQAAITAAAAVSGGVYFPRGRTFAINGTLNVPANVRLLSDGATIKRLSDATGLNITSVLGTNSAASAISGTSVTVTSSTGFAVGDVVMLSGAGISLYSEVVSVPDATHVTISDSPDFAITPALLSKATRAAVLIQGLRFTSNSAYTTFDILVNGANGLWDVEVRDCVFENTNGVEFLYAGYCAVRNSRFRNVNYAVQLYDTTSCVVDGCLMVYFNGAVYCPYVYRARITNNTIREGNNPLLSQGILLTGVNTTVPTGITIADKKASQCLVAGNTIINANKGQAGNVLGGIHLNKSAHRNTISGNVCQRNGVGIYLETDCDFNTIANNVCSYNDGYAGVGIELDLNCDFNTIVGNVCDYNSGLTAADESSGIQVRNDGLTDAFAVDTGNVVVGNSCSFNGKEGIRLNGDHNTASGNLCFSNGQNGAIADRREIQVGGNDNLVTGNQIVSPTGAVYGIRVLAGSRNVVEDNQIDVGATCVSILHATGAVNDFAFRGNFVKAINTGRGLNFAGVVGTHMTNVVVERNRIQMATNGFNALELVYVDGYRDYGNQYVTAQGRLFSNCTAPMVEGAAVLVFNSANLAIPDNNATALTFNSERLKSETGMHSTSANTDRVVIPTNGMYDLTANARFAAAANGVRQLIIQIDGATNLAVGSAPSAGAGDPVDVSVSRRYYLSVGQIARVLAYQNSGGAINVTANGNWSPEFSVQQVG